MKSRAALWLLLALGVLAVCVMQFSAAGRIPLQTNLLALLPPTERNPVAEQAISHLADATGNRAVFLVGQLHTSTLDAASAARSFASALQQTGVFRRVLVDAPNMDVRQLTAVYLQHRYTLLGSADRAALSAGSVNLQERLQRKLYQPFRLGLTLSPIDDPFGFTDAWLADLPLKNFKLELDNSVLVARDAQRTWVLVLADLPGSAYDGQVQQQVSSAVMQAENSLARAAPQAQVLRTGAVFYANEARASAEREVDVIGAGSLLGMLLLLYLFLRSLRPLGLGLLCIAFGIGAAVAVTIVVYGQLHLITLVFGASLIGEAIDYAIQYFAAYLGAGKDWEPMQGLRRIAPGLIVALATSLLGYSALALAPFPAFAQIALFALAGLSAAWVSVFLLLPALLVQPSKRDPVAASAGPARLLRWWQTHMNRCTCMALVALLLMLAAPGWWRLSSNDDVHLLVTRSPTLLAQEEKIRELTGLGNSSQFFLVEGTTPDAVLANEERLTARLNALTTRGDITAYQSLSAFVPSQGRQLDNRRLWQEHVFADEAGLKAVLTKSELRSEIADQQLAAFKGSAGQTLQLEDWLQTPLAAPVRHLWLGTAEPTSQGFASIVLPQGARSAALLAQAGANLPGVSLVDKAASVSQLLHDYRQGSACWLLLAMVLVYAVLCVRYGWQQAAVTLAPTLLAMALALGLLGYLGAALTLFNNMALMLVLGVGVNYAIFLREGGVREAATLAGVLLSAGTTLLSFGLLAFSSMPALSSFGLTLLTGVGLAALLSPMVLSFQPGFNK